MSAEKPVVRRLLVGLDASGHSLAALEAAALLAERFGAELVGLFVEDANLLHLASLPVGRVVDPMRNVGRTPGLPEMERALKVLASEARRAVEQAARKARVTWSFQVARGRVTPEILAASGSADLLCVGCAGQRSPRRRGLGSTARGAVAGGRTVLMLREGKQVRAPIVLVFDGSPASERALDVAVECLPHDERTLHLLVPEAEADRLVARARERLAPRRLDVRWRTLPYGGPDAVVAAVDAVAAGTLVLPAGGSLSTEGLETIVDAVASPVLLVR